MLFTQLITLLHFLRRTIFVADSRRVTLNSSTCYTNSYPTLFHTDSLDLMLPIMSSICHNFRCHFWSISSLGSHLILYNLFVRNYLISSGTCSNLHRLPDPAPRSDMFLSSLTAPKAILFAPSTQAPSLLIVSQNAGSAVTWFSYPYSRCFQSFICRRYSRSVPLGARVRILVLLY